MPNSFSSTFDGQVNEFYKVDTRLVFFDKNAQFKRQMKRILFFQSQLQLCRGKSMELANPGEQPKIHVATVLQCALDTPNLISSP